MSQLGIMKLKHRGVALKNLHIDIMTLSLRVWVLIIHAVYPTNARFLGIYI